VNQVLSLKNLSLLEILLPHKTMKRRAWPGVLALSYVALIYVLGGLRIDHILMSSLVILDYYNPHTRKFLFYFFPFILLGLVFDSMRYYYWQGVEGNIHVAGPYYRDLKYFGIPTEVGGVVKKLTPNEFFDLYQWKWVDVITGFAYITFIIEYLVTAVLLYVCQMYLTLKRFGWSFLTVNVMGFATYFIYPAAPPWYVTKYGFEPRMYVSPSSASAVRFDQIMGTNFFGEMYSKGIDVYGAYPSLHVAYPFLVMWVMCTVKEFKIFRIPTIFFWLLMNFSAVYLQHHYVVDILLGNLYAMITVWLIKKVPFKTETQG